MATRHDASICTIYWDNEVLYAPSCSCGWGRDGRRKRNQPKETVFLSDAERQLRQHMRSRLTLLRGGQA